MKKIIRRLLLPFLPQSLQNVLLKTYEKIQLYIWEKNGYPIPPPHIVKQLTIIEYKEKSNYKILIETGTFMGDMVQALKKRFDKIFSIELGSVLFEKAKKRFRKDDHVTILYGDSGKVLPKLMKEINEPAIFWLDGHYSEGITAKGEKDCPIFEELDSILNDQKFNHILLIDDARCFNGGGDYPTIQQLTEYIKKKNIKYQAEIKHDIIRFTV